MTTDQYISELNKRYKLGNATEHTFRGDLQQLIESMVPGIRATNEPKRQKCGAPDYILTKKEIPVGFIEAKDIGDADLEGVKKTGNKEQFDRYKSSLNNLIFTDYIRFYLYIDGQFITKVEIGELTFPSTGGVSEGRGGHIVPLPQNFSTFENLIKNFCTHISQTIKSPKKLAEMMASKARLLAEIIEKALTSDETNQENSTLKDQMIAFKQILIHDITPKGFADVYAQTIAYGMFAARYHDPTLPTFSREEAATLIPKSNPFLRKLFGYIAGPDLDDRIKWIVDSLVEIFLASDVADILTNFGKSTKTEDPIIHFYETFLSEYDPKLRKARGVWYTPQPVVNFIVRAVDDILKTEFDLPQGLADTSKIKIKVDAQGKKVEQEVHRVQILDPATGTGTFLAEVVKHIHKKFEGQQGIWSNYVENHLLPRLNGFELLMASYAMAHLKLDLLFSETGYKPTKEQRFRVYLTNSLEEHHPDTGTLFANWLSTEANEANHIKRDTPVMCIIGNPPYSGESSNKGEWIMNLMEDYKKEPGGKEKLKEQNSKFINDDYVKFLRYGQHFIEKNGSGVLAFINPHGFLDNPTFRGMRWHLLKIYDKIYTIDLHGNSKKKEITPDGNPDINVFDIQQGVSINIFIKSGKKKQNELGRVFHFEIYGKREDKYSFLSDKRITEIDFTPIDNIEPNYFFLAKDWKIGFVYNEFLSLNELFVKSTIGLQSHRDELVISFDKKELSDRFKVIFTSENTNIIAKRYNVKESLNWSLSQAIIKAKEFNNSEIRKLCYRAFDDRFIYYNENFVDRTRRSVGKEINENNFVLNFPKIVKVDWNHSLITKSIPTAISMDINGTYFAPLYCYSDNNMFDSSKRIHNLNPEIVKQIAEKLGLTFTNEKVSTDKASLVSSFAPIDILDYIYAILHSPTYREKYKEFLKIDFPRVPYPSGKDAQTCVSTFWQLVKLGGEIRQIHLLESPIVEKYITQYPVDGSNVVGKVRFELSDLPPDQPPGYITANPETYGIIKQFRTELKKNPTVAEEKLWQYLRNKKTGHKIRRQHVIDNYIADFVCLTKKLIIEVDGKIHDFQKEEDNIRTFALNQKGYAVIRFTNDEVMSNPQQVSDKIKQELDNRQDFIRDAEEPDGLNSPPLEGLGEVGRVYINETQYFANVPEIAWNFYIGGYQPAQKWLKDRKDRTLEFEDILHYQKIIVALSETDRLMKEIDKIEIE